MGSLTINSGAVIYIDANAMIYAVERVEPFATLLRPAWEASRSGTARLIESELSIIETLTGPLKRGDRSLASAYELALDARDIDLLPITAETLKHGASIRANHGLKTPDAIHAATALSAGCSMFLSNDAIFRRVPKLATVVLSDLVTS